MQQYVGEQVIEQMQAGHPLKKLLTPVRWPILLFIL